MEQHGSLPKFMTSGACSAAAVSAVLSYTAVFWFLIQSFDLWVQLQQQRCRLWFCVQWHKVRFCQSQAQ